MLKYSTYFMSLAWDTFIDCINIPVGSAYGQHYVVVTATCRCTSLATLRSRYLVSLQTLSLAPWQHPSGLINCAE